MADKRIYIYDSTLRDGAQTHGIDFSPNDKNIIARSLDRLGIDYIEGGWPGSNPTDDSFFANAPKLKSSRLVAFGMTRRVGKSASNDPSLRKLLQSGSKSVCIVGKSWDFQVRTALGVNLKENLRMITDSLSAVAKKFNEVMFDAEHFFDGYKDNSKYSLECIKAAYDSGVRWVVLCDTNGGVLPHEVEEIMQEVTQVIPGKNLGIHFHNDTDNAVANSLAAVRYGARQIQGTFNGLGERCGNTNLVSIIPNLVVKMGFKTGITWSKLKHLTGISRIIDECLNRAPQRNAPYVGESAFAHKGGLHVSAVRKNPACYEHISPNIVGNRRKIVVSDQSGKAGILSQFKEMGLKANLSDSKIAKLLNLVKEREFEGYSYDGAEASFELLIRQALGKLKKFFQLEKFLITDERIRGKSGRLRMVSYANIIVTVKKKKFESEAKGNGPINALDAALRKVLISAFPVLKDVKLVDYKVRILTPNRGTEAVIRVMIESIDKNRNRWSTVGVSANVIDASYIALRDSLNYKLFKTKART